MLPFFNMRINRNYNLAILQPFIDKMKKNELTLENILEEDEIIQDLKTNQNSQFIYMLSNEHIRKLIDYATKMPKSDDRNVGYKYPFNATEILCCDNNAVMEKIMNEIHLGGDSDDEEDEKDEKENKEEEKEEKEENSEEKKDENEEFVEVKEDEKKEKEKEVNPEQNQEQEPEQNEPDSGEKKEESEAPKEKEVKDEAPKTEEPKKEEEQPKPEENKEEVPKPEEPKKEEEQPKPEEKVEEPKKEEEQPKPEEKVEEPKKEEEQTKPEEKVEEPNKEGEQPKPEEKVEEPKKEEEQPKTEEKVEEPKKEEEQPKPEENKEEEKPKEGEAQTEKKPKEEEQPEQPEPPKEEPKKEEKTEEEPKKEELEKKPEDNNKEEEGEPPEEIPDKQENEEEPKQEQEPQKNEEEQEKDDDQEQEKEEEEPKEYTVIYDNVDYLLSFLNESEETKSNYVLVGYFYKILNHLFNSQSTKIVQYLFDYPKKNEFDVLGLIVKNMKRKSMGEIVNKLLLFQEEGGEDFLQKRLELLEKVLEELKETTEEDKYECICSTLENTFYNKGFFLEFMKDPKFLDMMYTILEQSQSLPKKLMAVLKLFINIHENILKNLDNRCTTSVAQENPMDFLSMFNGGYALEEPSQKEINPEMEQILTKVFTNLITLIEKNNFNFLNDLDDYSQPENGEFMTTYQVKQKKLGMKKLSQIEFFRTILDILVNTYFKYEEQPIRDSIINIINKAQEKKIFWKMHKLFLDFPFCNLYQTFYSQILDIILNENSPECLIKYTFLEEEGEDKKNLIQIFIDKTIKEMEFKFISGRTAFHPNYSFQISILNKIIESTNPFVVDLIKDDKNLAVFDKILGKEVDAIFKQKLLLSGDKDIQLGPNIPSMTKEEDDLKYFGKKNFMELLEEDNQIYDVYLKGGDYEKLLNEKKEREKKEQEERKKLEEEVNEGGEEEGEEQNIQTGLGESINNFDDGGEQEGEVQKDEEEFKEKLDSGTEEVSEETEEDKSFNDVNFWKPSIKPDDNIMNAVLNDLD